MKPKKAARKNKPAGRSTGPPPQAVTQPVVKADPNDRRIFFRGEDPSGVTVRCPRCSHVLAIGIKPGQIRGLSVQCPTCGMNVPFA